MPKRIDDDNDVKESIDSFSDDTGRISIPMGRSALYILSADYVDGYNHWISLPDGRKMPITCGGGVAGGGFAPNDCLLCKHTVDLYKKAKSEDDEDKSDKIKKQGNELRARYSAELIAAIGELVNRGDGMRFEPDFEDADVGRLPFTQKQYQDFINLRGSSTYPCVKSGKDLTNRVFLVEKKHERDAKGKKVKYTTIKFIPSKRISEPPVDVDLDADEYSLDNLFVIDTKEIKKAYRLLTTGKKKSKAPDDDEDDDLDFEDDGDDFEEDDAIDTSDDDADDNNTEEDFEEELPWEEEDLEESASNDEIDAEQGKRKKTAGKRSTKSKGSSRKKR